MVDAIYQFTLPTARRVVLSATTVPTSTRRIVLTVRSACAAGTDVICRSGMGDATPAPTMLAAGTYYVIVEQSEADAGDFSLDFSLL